MGAFMNAFVVLFLAVLLFAGPVLAAEQKSETGYLKQGDVKVEQKVPYMIAFLAGILSVLSPCSLPLLLGYLAVMSKEKRGFWPKTLAFFIGLSIVWVLLGISASGLGSLVAGRGVLFNQIAGLVILVFGIVFLLGYGLPTIRLSRKVDTTILGMFVFGALFTLAWIPCVGPVLGSILIIASGTGVVEGTLLLLLYAAGFMLAVVAIFLMIKRGGQRKAFSRGFTVLGKKISLANLLGGVFLIVLGLVYLFNQINTVAGAMAPLADIGSSLENTVASNTAAAGVIALVIILAAIWLSWKKE